MVRVFFRLGRLGNGVCPGADQVGHLKGDDAVVCWGIGCTQARCQTPTDPDYWRDQRWRDAGARFTALGVFDGSFLTLESFRELKGPLVQGWLI